MDNKEMIEILIKKLVEKEQGIESNLNTYNNHFKWTNWCLWFSRRNRCKWLWRNL